MLGLDYLYLGNEGKLVAVVPESNTESVLAAMHRHVYGRSATLIGRVTEEHPDRGWSSKTRSALSA